MRPGGAFARRGGGTGGRRERRRVRRGGRGGRGKWHFGTRRMCLGRRADPVRAELLLGPLLEHRQALEKSGQALLSRLEGRLVDRGPRRRRLGSGAGAATSSAIRRCNASS